MNKKLTNVLAASVTPALMGLLLSWDFLNDTLNPHHEDFGLVYCAVIIIALLGSNAVLIRVCRGKLSRPEFFRTLAIATGMTVLGGIVMLVVVLIYVGWLFDKSHFPDGI